MASKRALPFGVNVSDNVEAKRLELLERNDWQQLRQRKRPRYSFPTFDDKQQVGRRRKLTMVELERHTARRKSPLRRVIQEFAELEYRTRCRKRSPNPGDVSIRLGSRIHGSQRTFTQRGSAGEAIAVQHEGSLHDATYRPAGEELSSIADTQESERERIGGIHEDREMLDNVSSSRLIQDIEPTAAPQSDMSISPRQAFARRRSCRRRLKESCPPSRLGTENAENRTSMSRVLHSDAQLAMHAGARAIPIDEVEADYIMPDAPFRSSPPPFRYSANPDTVPIAGIGAKSTLSRSIQVNSSGYSEISVNSSENRLWKNFPDIPTSTVAVTTNSIYPRSYQDVCHHQGLAQRLMRRESRNGLDEYIEVKSQVGRKSMIFFSSSETDSLKPHQSAVMTESPNAKSDAAKEISSQGVTSAEDEIWRKIIFGNLDGPDGVSVEVHPGDKEIEPSSEAISKLHSPGKETTETYFNNDEAPRFHSSMAVEATRTPIDSAGTTSASSSDDGNTVYKSSEPADGNPNTSSMLVEPSQWPEASKVEPYISSSLLPYASYEEIDSDLAILHPPSLGLLDSATHRRFPGPKLLFTRPASFVGRTVHVTNGHTLSDSSGLSTVELALHTPPC